MQSGDGKQLDLQRQAVKFFVVVMESMCMRLIGTNSSLVALGWGVKLHLVFGGRDCNSFAFRGSHKII